jgi:hypothetical protein
MFRPLVAEITLPAHDDDPRVLVLISSELLGINDSGQIGGFSSSGGFLDSGGSFTRINFTGSDSFSTVVPINRKVYLRMAGFIKPFINAGVGGYSF